MNRARDWTRVEAAFEPVSRASLGVIGLATDRVGIPDFEAFLRPFPDVAVFGTRVPMAPVATPETLRAMTDYLRGAAALLVPDSPLDVVAFSCTSGTVAIGPEVVDRIIGEGRAGVRVTTPIRGAVAGLEALGVRRISLLVPYLPETADLILGHFEEAGFLIDARATFGLDGDPQMNRVSRAALIEAAARVMAPASEALFISCTGLRTAGLPAVLEERLGRPVLTSNGALAWHALRLAGVAETRPNQGALFAR